MYALNILGCDVRVATFRERFLFLQHEKGVSLEQIAKVVNSNKASLSKFVNGKLNLKADLIDALAKYFDVDKAYLLGESNIRNNTNNAIPEDYIGVSKYAIDKKVPADVLYDFIELWTKKEQK
jgi:transcriptional regulator with XRE-family HTH domain